jgi:hypothetical protein
MSFLLRNAVWRLAIAAFVAVAFTELSDDEVSVRMEPGTQAGARGDVVLVSYLRKAVTPIGRGENAGRTLAEYNIVRSVQTLGHWDGAAREFRTKVASLPRDATDVAVLVQSPGQGAILSAATHPVR